jgi:hypothetical protein
MLEQKWQISLFATQKQENDWANTPNQGALRCVPPAPLSRLAGYALAVGCQPGVLLIMSLMYSLPVNANVYPDCDYSLSVSHVQEAVVSYRA